MTSSDLTALLAAIAGDRAAAARHADRAVFHAGALGDDVAQTVVAASLHHFYGAIESLLERTLRTFGQTLPAGGRWHQDLLEQAALDLPGLRPALVGAATVLHLRRLLAFRHFFRHAYAVAWDPAELAANVAALETVRPLLDADLDRFVATVRDALGAPL